jgi:hypothetical protein
VARRHRAPTVQRRRLQSPVTRLKRKERRTRFRQSGYSTILTGLASNVRTVAPLSPRHLQAKTTYLRTPTGAHAAVPILR